MNISYEDVTTSLFDYLGEPAGPQLGMEVATAAGKAKEPVLTRQVKTKTYEGPINMYRRCFLDSYFGRVTQIASTDIPIDQLDLPF